MDFFSIARQIAGPEFETLLFMQRRTIRISWTERVLALGIATILTIVALSQTYLYKTVPPIRLMVWFPMIFIVESISQAGLIIFLTVILQYFIFATAYLFSLHYCRRRFAVLVPIGLYLMSLLVAWFIYLKLAATNSIRQEAFHEYLPPQFQALHFVVIAQRAITE
jgi:hypothetical protein